MDIGSILILLALLLLVGIYIARPILEHKGKTVSVEEHELSVLLAERDRTLNALQELDFDYTLGKIPEEDYPAQRARMLQYGADILRKLDAYTPQPVSDTAEERLEQAIIARRIARQPVPTGAWTTNGNGGNGISHPDDQLEARIAERRRNRKGKAAGFCHQCGSPLQQSDRFCPRCGNEITQ
jgi:hypothetical protein